MEPRVGAALQVRLLPKQPPARGLTTTQSATTMACRPSSLVGVGASAAATGLGELATITPGLQTAASAPGLQPSSSSCACRLGTAGSTRSRSITSNRVEVSALTDTGPSQAPRLLVADAAQQRQTGERLSGTLAVEIAPPEPPPSEIPEEYRLYDLHATRRAATLVAASPRGVQQTASYVVFPSTRPSNRSEVHHLARTLEAMLEKAGPRTAEALGAWDLTLSELVRQVFVSCADRGELLGRVRRAYRHYICEMVDRVRFMESTAREVEIRRLEKENAELKAQLGESKTAVKRSLVLSRFQTAYAQNAGSKWAAMRQAGHGSRIAAWGRLLPHRLLHVRPRARAILHA